MPRTKEQNDAIKEERIKLIANNSLKVFCEKGYENTTICDIAKSSKVSHSLFYHYFKNKQEIFDYIFHELNDKFLNKLNNIESDNLKPLDKLIAITDFLINPTSREENFAFKFYLMISKYFFDTHIKQIFVKKPKQKMHFVAMLEDIFLQLKTAKIFSLSCGLNKALMTYWSIVEGLNMQYLTIPSEFWKDIPLPSAKEIVRLFYNF